jgi:HEAT repeat protein
VAALRAVGRLGGEGALDALMRGLAEGELSVQNAAAEGLGDLADPESISLLTSMLSRGRSSAFFEPARRGLLKLGPEAHSEVLRLTLTGVKETRREAALLLAEQSVPAAASTLISILTDRPSDARVAAELAVLSGRDLRSAPDPAQAWWEWWDAVVHDDALAWFRGACEREGLGTMPAAALAGPGTQEGATFLIGVMRRGAPHLVERARRELGRLLGADVGALPPVGALRNERLEELTELATRHFTDDGR